MRTVAGMKTLPAALGLVAADLPRTLAFYRTLGVDIAPEADSEPHVELTLPGGFRVMWDPESTITSFDPSWTPPPSGSSRVGLAFECDSPGEVDQVYARMTGAGYEGHLEPFDAPWGQRYASLRDPDGNGVDLYATR
jgi:catechol 2,3-dioxygenase-like lactoylglutathione lyase family enzyme